LLSLQSLSDCRSGFHGHVRAGAKGNADIRLGQGRGVIDAIAHHGYNLAGVLQMFDVLGFGLWQHLSQDMLDA
jgi:hypothetical protein